MTHDPLLDGITRYSVRNDYLTSRAAVGDEPFKGSTDVVLFSDLPALIAAVREEFVNEVASMLIEATAAGIKQGQRDERERLLTDALWKRGQALFLTEGDIDRLRRLVQRDERDRIRTAMGKALFREDGRLHSVGSSVDAGGGIEFCCSCSASYEAAEAILAIIEGTS